jgi:hypothetical protein
MPLPPAVMIATFVSAMSASCCKRLVYPNLASRETGMLDHAKPPPGP